MYGHSNGTMTRARTKQLQSILTNKISMTEALMSLEACKTFENNIKLFNFSFREFCSLFFHFKN
jgi:hypothetical protein